MYRVCPFTTEKPWPDVAKGVNVTLSVDAEIAEPVDVPTYVT
jgi:hypothetical protein